MTEPLIQDIPSLKKTLEDAKNIRAFKQAMPFLRPLLKLFNVDVAQIDEALTPVDDLEKMAHDIATIPDRFNDIFAERGWIIYERMSLDVAKAAVEKAEAGDIDGAEADLVAYYNDEHVAYSLRTMSAVQAFRPRMRLAEKALVDYQEERYHACVPVVLALLDGMVNELHEKRLGFFNKETSLEAWDSIATHSKGLDALNRIFQKSRRKTVADEISIPYRHGILHGMDLGYDNRMVTAKCWATLFAAREWALKAERGQLTAPPEEPKKTWRELFDQLRENQRQKELLEKWQPRTIQIGTDVPAAGTLDMYKKGTPERRLAEYLYYWIRRNYGFMAKYVPNLGRVSEKAMAGGIRERLSHMMLKSFEISSITDIAAAVTEIGVTLVIESNGRETEQNFTFRLINQNAEGRTVIRGEPNGEWVIYNWGKLYPLKLTITTRTYNL
jgi:hypothetical protein